MSSLAPNKNIGWIIESAKLTPDATFVIAGSSRIEESFGADVPANVIFPGFVTDEEAKALMSECTAFLFPTLYEGFGLPPLEALSCGANIVVSDTPCMHEVYGDSAFYADPAIAINAKIAQKNDGNSCLDKYSWKSSSEAFCRLLMNGCDRD